MKIGELARATQISVRTLHHYDEIKLLRPSSRNEADHRIYTGADIARLHRIVSLRNVGFSLEDIGRIVGQSQDELHELIARQQEKIDAEIEELKRRQWCLRAVTEASAWQPYQGTEILLNMIRELSVQSQYFSTEERDTIDNINSAIGLERAKEMHIKLAELTQRAQAYMDLHLPPTDSRVIALANEWRALGKEGLGANPQIVQKVKTMLAENPEIAAYRGITPALMQYLKTAFVSQPVQE